MKKHILVWLLTLTLLVVAWGVSKVTLPDDSTIAPFPVAATVGEQAVTRNLAVTVTDVRLANRVTDAKGWSAEGSWLVVDLEAASVVTQELGTLSLAQLVIGDRTFSATDRGTTLVDQRLITGVPRSGSLAFELPEDALTGRATLRLGVPSGSYREVLLDGVIDLPIALDDLPVDAEVLLDENGWAR
ncbi:DUF4352 domain-containing protein [Microbacterium saperdae]